jgi:hypothetical protein
MVWVRGLTLQAVSGLWSRDDIFLASDAALNCQLGEVRLSVAYGWTGLSVHGSACLVGRELSVVWRRTGNRDKSLQPGREDMAAFAAFNARKMLDHRSAPSDTMRRLHLICQLLNDEMDIAKHLAAYADLFWKR